MESTMKRKLAAYFLTIICLEMLISSHYPSVDAFGSCGVCSDTFNGKAYHFKMADATKFTMNIYRHYCENFGGGTESRLSIRSQAMNDFVVSKMIDYRPNVTSEAYVGCTANDTYPPRRWGCIGNGDFYIEGSNTFQGYWNWKTGEPNAIGRCIILDTSTGKWRTSGCGPFADFAICECEPDTFRSASFQAVTPTGGNCLNSSYATRLVPAHTSIRCANECQADCNCASYAMKKGEGNTFSQRVCAISNMTQSSLPPSAFHFEEGCRYYERMN